MKYRSTRGGQTATLDEALLAGIARDGGLFVPERLPAFDSADFDGDDTLTSVARRLLTPFFEGSSLAAGLEGVLAETFSFPIPLRELPGTDTRHLLELFHGPTAAFKDVGAGFLAACLSRLAGGDERPVTILVATSGDTGGAVAAAFDGRPGMRVVVLFPEGRVSARQAHQLCCWGDNVLSLAVHGSFDDCQRLVKQAMANAELSARWRFSSANSINVGRLLPQCIYYAQASLACWRARRAKPGFIVPTGNLGNALACMLVREMGLPVGDIVLATNANRMLVDYLDGGEWRPRASLRTLATAMDVGDPGNMERVRALFGEAGELRGRLRAMSVTDDEIEQEIRDVWSADGLAICPHTATASRAWRRLPDADRQEAEWVIVATAHPAKFESVVEPLIGRDVPLPAALQGVLSRPARSTAVEPRLEAVEAAMRDAFAT